MVQGKPCWEAGWPINTAYHRVKLLSFVADAGAQSRPTSRMLVMLRLISKEPHHFIPAETVPYAYVSDTRISSRKLTCHRIVLGGNIHPHRAAVRCTNRLLCPG